ncbi:YdcF family protein [Spirosoma sp. KNUC1025]|uniref:YdcF family protein n=1 Tax=Spirosoma sp. KNUC1025 TaxID=2894082 RepID=UPI0038642989|nr:YdcF family protein [Spirosoma sp. KNUC1025]
MFYFFSKTITYLLTPAGWLVSALLFAFFTKNVRRRRQWIGIALGIFWVFGNPFLVNELALWWEYPIVVSVPAPADSSVQVGVLLTGGMALARKEIPADGRRPADRFLLGREADRAGQALYLYKTKAIQKILISGGVGNVPFRDKSVSDEGQLIARFLRVAGVPATDIVLETKSLNTHENAVFSIQLLQSGFHTKRCVLITSAWHMRRAVACFEKEGAIVTPFSGSFISSRRSFAPGEWVLPHEEAFFNGYYLIRELVGYVTYKLAGYI